mgnify:CR=1 FL=1
MPHRIEDGLAGALHQRQFVRRQVLDPLGEQLKKDIVGRCGFLAKVIVENSVAPGETITVLNKN